MKQICVFKFGGSSVADAARLQRVAGLIAQERLRTTDDVGHVVVVSALQGVTDALQQLLEAPEGTQPGDLEAAELAREARIAELQRRHEEVLRELQGDVQGDLQGELQGDIGLLAPVFTRLRAEVAARESGHQRPSAEQRDAVVAAGEDLSSLLLTQALQGAGVPATHIDARSVVRTDATFGEAHPDEGALAVQASAVVRPVLEAGRVAVLGGFIGATADGRTTTLGRGGSDYSATLVGAALEASEVHIWTDVDGVLSGDPRAVATPRNLATLGFEETVELAHFGAKVLHAAAAKHAVARGLTVRVRSTFAPEREGTVILRERHGPAGVAAVAHKTGVALIQVRSHPSAMPFGFLARVFEVLARHQVPVDLVATSHTSTAFTLDRSQDLSAVERELADFADVRIRHDLATVTVVGRGLMREPGINARVFDVVGRTPVHLVSQASDVSLSLVVDEPEAVPLVGRLHAELIEAAASHLTSNETN